MKKNQDGLTHSQLHQEASLQLFLEALLLGRKAAQIPGNTQNALDNEKGGTPGWISFCKFCCRHGTM